MEKRTAVAEACANIAFIKYWGNKDHDLILPANSSISMNLDGLVSRTQVSFNGDFRADRLRLNGEAVTGAGLARASRFLGRVRQMAGISEFAEIVSENNFPTGAGIASSSSGFAALSLAASAAAGLELNTAELSRLARRGSGSASRSVPGGFVAWEAGDSDETSLAASIAPPEHWNLVDCIAVVSDVHKSISSLEGHRLAHTSPLQEARIADAPRRFEQCRRAILERDFPALAEVAELENHLMHGVMMTSKPTLLYWQPATLTVIQAVRRWQKEGFPVCYTTDAGPNVHVICEGENCDEVTARLKALPGVMQTFTAGVGGPARWVDSE